LLTTVKFLTKHHNGLPWLRMTHARSGRWGDCLFVTDPQCDRYDWLVVYDDLPSSHPREPLACPPAQTILVTNEPPSIKLYEPAYTRQFGHVVTSQPAADLPHPRRHHRASTLLWYYGQKASHLLDREQLLSGLPPKTADLSTVCSSKRQRHTLHRLRYDFTQALKARLPALEIFGHGVRPVVDKVEALAPYRLHLVFENHHAPRHWTEKLSDAFLAGCLPLYHGCPDAELDFPADSFVRFNPHDVEGTARLVEELIATDAYSRRLPAILEARRRVLDEQQLFAVVAGLVAAEPPAASRPLPGAVLHGRRSSRLRHPLRAVPFLLSRALRRWLRAGLG
jgi:hypothetical protein